VPARDVTSEGAEHLGRSHQSAQNVRIWVTPAMIDESADYLFRFGDPHAPPFCDIPGGITHRGGWHLGAGGREADDRAPDRVP
jgi:hypothetical protein